MLGVHTIRAIHQVEASSGLNLAPSLAVFLVLPVNTRRSPLKLPFSSEPLPPPRPPSFGPVSGSSDPEASSANHSNGPQDLSSFLPLVSGTLPFGIPFAPLHRILGCSEMRLTAACMPGAFAGTTVNPAQPEMIAKMKSGSLSIADSPDGFSCRNRSSHAAFLFLLRFVCRAIGRRARSAHLPRFDARRVGPGVCLSMKILKPPPQAGRPAHRDLAARAFTQML